ncbi:MAG: hypothetical protein KME08_09730 [Aphanothece sp. CMT-3BRIN-NPC111]|jgi:hypothetical protein|nr:hypothetical protein [Aphanothece sp. CMT-3BRIN-NPC111]
MNLPEYSAIAYNLSNLSNYGYVSFVESGWMRYKRKMSSYQVSKGSEHHNKA